MDDLIAGRGKQQPGCRLYEGIEYREFWAGAGKYKLDQLERAIVRDLLPPRGNRLIDIGCGYGRLADCYQDRFRQVIMLDGSMSLLREARARTAGQAIYIAADAHHIPLRAATCDAALMVRVFHHLQGWQACLDDAHRILCNEGHLVFNYSNRRNILRIVMWLARVIRNSPFVRAPLSVEPAFVHHHPDSVAEMLEAAGFSHFRYRGAGVVDKLAAGLGSWGRHVPPGAALAPLLGELRLAPWMFCQATAIGSGEQHWTDAVEELLECPLCGGGLIPTESRYRCIACDNSYPVVDGIIDLRLN